MLHSLLIAGAPCPGMRDEPMAGALARQDRVARLRRRIAAGTYRLDRTALADSILDCEPGVTAPALRRQMHALLHDSIAVLDDNAAMILQLALVEQADVREIAAILHLASDAAVLLRRRALDALTILLDSA